MKRWSAIFLIPIIFFSPAFADVPPSYEDFEVPSQNGKYVAEVKRVDENKTFQPSEGRFELVVSEMRDGEKNKLWSCRYDDAGYSEGILSDDGSTFAYVNVWYSDDAPVVSIYRNGSKVVGIPGRDFHVDPLKLVETASHRLWLTEKEPKFQFANRDRRLVLEVSTIDGNKHGVDSETGMISRNSNMRSLGYPLSTPLTIEGINHAPHPGVLTFARTIHVDTVNGVKLKKTVSLHIRNVNTDLWPGGTHFIFKGYVTGEWVGCDDGCQTPRHFLYYFIVTRAESPQAVKIEPLNFNH